MSKKPLPVIPGRRAALATLSREERGFARQWGDVPALPLTAKRGPLFRLPRINVERVLVGALLAVAFVSGAAAFNLANAPAPYARLIATTADGNVYTVGDGDTCKEVYDRDPLPANIVRLECATADGAWNVITGGL